MQFVVHYRSPVAEFEVIDTGPGIQATDLERIFAPFERGALGVSQPQTGTGLGLTISRLLAGVMGGDIQVTSTVGTGSTFRVKMLLSEVTNPTRIAPVDAPVFGYHGPRKTILVTDDDPVQRDLLREVLTPLGFILLSAPDGPGLPCARAALPARSVPAGYLDGRHGRLDGRGDAALDAAIIRPAS